MSHSETNKSCETHLRPTTGILNWREQLADDPFDDASVSALSRDADLQESEVSG